MRGPAPRTRVVLRAIAGRARWHRRCNAALRTLPTRIALLLCAGLALGLGRPTALAQEAPPPALVQHAATLDGDLARLQRQTRVYFASWSATNTALASAQIAIALSTHSDAIRSNYFVGAGLSAAGLLALLAQPWPGLRAHTRYRRMPSGNLRELTAKVLLGESLLARQMNRNAIAIGGFKHVVAAAVALGAGIRAGFSFDSVWQGVGRTLFVLVVLEGQILTHPGQHYEPRSDRSMMPRLIAATLSPWIERHIQGVSLAARF